MRSTPPDALDSRTAFLIYAAAAFVSGALFLAWGPGWLGTVLADGRWRDAASMRVAGAGVMALGICALAFARVDSPLVRHRCLLWFSIANGIVAGAILLQQHTVPGGVDAFGWASAVATGFLVHAWSFPTSPQSVWGSRLADVGWSTASPRRRFVSEYEQSIRQAARLEERHRLARDVHDGVKQQLFIIQTAAATAQARHGHDAAGERSALEQIRRAGREAAAELEVLLDQLQAEPLEYSGLVAALKRQAEALAFRAGCRVHVSHDPLPSSGILPPGAAEVFFRVAQEALANVGKHARATQVDVSLEERAGLVTLRVHDNGSGFDPAARQSGMGTAGMRTRASDIGGTFEITSVPGTGTTVRLSIPYSETADREAYAVGVVTWGSLAATALLLFVARGDTRLSPWGVFGALWTARYLLAYWRTRAHTTTIAVAKP